METLSIAFLCDKAAPRFVGGYEIRILELARRLARTHNVSVYTSSTLALEQVDHVTFHRVCPTTFQAEQVASRSLAHSAIYSALLSSEPSYERRPDILVIEAIPYLQLPLARSWARRAAYPIVLDVCEAWNSYSYGWPPLSIGTKFVIRNALKIGIGFSHRVTSISEVTARSLQRYYGLSADRVTVIPMGIDSHEVSSYLSKEGTTSQPYGSPDFCMVCRLVPSKRPQDLVRALGLLKRRHGWNGTAVVIGDGPMRMDLVTLANAEGVAANVHFMGYLSDSEKFRVLASAKIFVLTSAREGFSLATLEALACGVPAVVARPKEPEVFGVSDIVRDGYDGLYYPAGDTNRLSQVLSDLLTATTLRSALTEHAQQVASRYDWNSISGEFENMLRQVTYSVSTTG